MMQIHMKYISDGGVLYMILYMYMMDDLIQWMIFFNRIQSLFEQNVDHMV